MLIDFEKLSLRTGNILKNAGITDTNQLKGVDLKAKIDNTLGYSYKRAYGKSAPRKRKPTAWMNFGRKSYLELIEYLAKEFITTEA